MRVLLVHNYYGSTAPSGENKVFDAERALLAVRGNTIEVFVRHSDEIRTQGIWGAVKGGFSTPWNLWMARAISRAVEKFRPDVVHVHNTFPLISPAIFHAIGSRAARVLTLHNYRLYCAAAIPMRVGKVCTLCLDRRSTLPALRYGCYRGSRLATLPLSSSVALHRALGTWTKQVNAFIALTEFQRERMIEAGLPAYLMHVKPNFYPGNPSVVSWDVRRPSVVFVGRLTAEKGVAVLVQAWLMWGASAPELRIVGDGGLREDLQRLAATAPRVPIRFLGQVESDVALEEIARARLLVLPSQWFEGFPMVVREAFAFGTPVAVSNIGPLPHIVNDGKNGVIFPPGDARALLGTIRKVWGDENLLKRLSAGARAEFEDRYTEDANYEALMNIYRIAMAVHRKRDSQEHK